MECAKHRIYIPYLTDVSFFSSFCSKFRHNFCSIVYVICSCVVGSIFADSFSFNNSETQPANKDLEITQWTEIRKKDNFFKEKTLLTIFF